MVKKSAGNPAFFTGTRIFSLSFCTCIAILSFLVFDYLTKEPDLPELDPNEWWGAEDNGAQDTSIRPFSIEFSDVVIYDLKERLTHRRPFTKPLKNAGFTYGFNTNTLEKVLDFWQNKYDFKAREHFLNKYQHYKTNIQGLDIHFMHVKPKDTEGLQVVPILLLHGWPGSIREFYELIPLLTERRNNFDYVFEVIVPSLPGYGYSDAASRPGLAATEVAVIMSNLMKRLDIDKYIVQGGDWGHVIGSNMATLYPQHVLGFHSNCLVLATNRLVFIKWLLGSFWPSWVEKDFPERLYPAGEHFSRFIEETGYFHLQATKPDTVGVALTDSPAGLAAYILEKFSTWTNPNYKRAADGELMKKYTLTSLLDNVMIYWSTNTITSSLRLYAESMSAREIARQMESIPTYVPVWAIKFKYELLYQPDGFLKQKYRNLLHSTVVDDGGHFAAFENPGILAEDIFKAGQAFQEFRGYNGTTTKPKNDYKTAKTIYEFTVKDIQGNDISLEKYRGYVCLIVNVASECGLTDRNYDELNILYEKYSKKGLKILTFPCNQFLSQEPGHSKDILKFITQRNVQYDVFEKINVNGDSAHPLWKFLKFEQSGAIYDDIKWNFSKFIVNRDGIPVERHSPTTNPLDLVENLEKYLY